MIFLMTCMVLGILPAAADERPYLELDPGAHTASVNKLVFTPDGKRLLSASEDKTVRLWDLASRKTIRIFRGQIGTGVIGAINDIALSPDGKYVAVGGAFADRGEKNIGLIRIHDLVTGQIVRVLEGHTDSVQALRFSKDGKRLLSGSRDKTAILWSVEQGRPIVTFVGHDARVTAVDFLIAPDQFITGSEDHTLRVWNLGGTELERLTKHSDSVRSIAVSLRDGTIASSGWDGEMLLWNAISLAFERRLDVDADGAEALAFTPSGKLVATYRAKSDVAITYLTSIFDPKSGKKLVAYTGGEVGGRATAIDPSGRFAAVGGGQTVKDIIVWDLASGRTITKLNDLGSPKWAVGFSRDGQQLVWGERYDRWEANNYGPLEFAIQLPDQGRPLGQARSLDPAISGDTVGAQKVLGALRLEAAGKTDDPKGIWNQNRLGVFALSNNIGTVDWSATGNAGYEGYRHQAYTLARDGGAFVSGGANGTLLSYYIDGQIRGRFTGHSGYVWAVAVSPDNRLLASAGGDQTVRLWNFKTHELIISLFHHPDGTWVMWTPQGFYTGSPGADAIVGWRVNMGEAIAAGYVKADQLRQQLNRPDIVERAIVMGSAETAIKEAYGGSFVLSDILKRPPPRLSVKTDNKGVVVRGDRAAITVVLSNTPDPVKRIRIQVNGRQTADRVPGLDSGGFQAGEYAFDVPLAEGRNDVRVIAVNAIGETEDSLTVTHEGRGALDKRGNLYILAIGVDRYAKIPPICGETHTASCDLRFSGADAAAFAAAIEKKLGPSHEAVEKRLLINGGGEAEPTAANILDAIGFLKKAGETDTVVVFVAGHGINEGDSYRFLPTDAERTDVGWRGSSVVPWYALQEALETAQGRRLLFVDTCHSGNAYNKRLDNAAYHANFIAYASARWDQLANERDNLVTQYSRGHGHGLFTYAVIEGLDGKVTGSDAKHQIGTTQLHAYVVQRVGALATEMKRSQEPQYFRGRDAEDFALVQW